MSTTQTPAPAAQSFDYTEEQALKGKATRDTYVGTVTIALPDGRRLVVFTRNTIAHARGLAVKALSNPSYQGRFVAVMASRE